MHVVVINFAASEGGALSILRDFSNQAKLYHDIRWTFILSENYIDESDNIKIIIQPKEHVNRLKFDFFQGKDIINRLKPSVVFNMQNTFVYGVKYPQVIYLHQPLPFQQEKNFSFFKSKERKYAVIQHGLGQLIKNGLPHADEVIVQTEWMKDAISKVNNLDNDKIKVISPTIPSIKKKKPSPQLGNKFFYPTSDILYKKNEFLIDVVKDLNTEYSNLEFNLKMTINSSMSIKNIDFIGRVSREEVFELMSQSVLVFPSEIETYGMPLMEARALGTRIFAGNTLFGHELLEGYPNAYFFDLNDKESLKDLMVKSIRGDLPHKDVPTNQKNRSQINSWDEVIQLLITNGSNRQLK